MRFFIHFRNCLIFQKTYEYIGPLGQEIRKNLVSRNAAAMYIESSFYLRCPKKLQPWYFMGNHGVNHAPKMARLQFSGQYQSR